MIASAGLICGLLSSLVLLFFGRSRNSANIYLGLAVLFLTHGLLMGLLNLSGWILEIPILMRTGNFTIYLFTPFLYLFYRGVFKSERKWKPVYFLFFIPAIIYLIDYSPFFLQASDDKIRVFSKTLSTPGELIKINEGLLGWDYFHASFRTMWSGLMLLLIAKILVEFRMDFKNNSNSRNVLFYGRLVALWSIIFVLLVIPALGYLFFDIKLYTPFFILTTVSATLILLTLNLLFSPRILYGYYWIFDADANPPNSPDPSDHRNQNTEDIELLNQINSVMENRLLFENVGYTIHNLAQETGIPSYRISYVINTCTGKSFSNWINSFRVERFIDLAANGKASKYTLDSMAPECGFSSRSTLIAAFKREKGMTPGKYLKSVVPPQIQDIQ